MTADDPDGSDSQRTGHERLAINRREYLGYTIAATGGLAGGPGLVASDAGEDDDSTPSTVTAPVDLRVEYAENPLGVDARQPRFSWKIPSQGRGLEQSAYRIVVTTGDPRDDEEVYWDSGKVATAMSTNIPYGGPALQAGERYNWRVRVWDGDGEASDWSEPALWEMGLFGDSGWNAEWIGYDTLTEDPQKGWSDYTVETDFVVENRTAGLVFRAQDPNNLYMWQINTVRGPHPLLRPHVREGGQWRALEPVSLEGVLGESPNAQHRAKIVLQGDEITTYIEGQQVDSRVDATHSTGTIGFRQDGPEHARFDNVLVTDSGGEVLFQEDFTGTEVEGFTGGSLSEGMLDVQGTGVILHESGESPAPLLRKEVTIGKTVEKASAHIAGLGSYKLYLNGEEVGNRELDPGRTDYEETVLYSTFDVTDELLNGANAIGVSLGRGRYGELLPNTFNWHDAPWWSDPELCFQLDVEFEDGTETSIVSDDSWSVADGPTRFDSLYGGESYDARKERTGWSTPDFDDSDWSSVTTGDGPAGDLTSQRVQPMRVTETIEPVGRTEPEPDVYVFDIGQMIAGWVELTVDGPQGAEVTLSLGEKVSPETGLVNNENTHIPGDMQVDRYVLDGDGTETWEPQFTYKGFRYVQVEGFPGTPELDDIVAKVVHTAVDEKVDSDFESSSGLLNQIHRNTQWAILNNTHSVPEDTPAREKNGYGADAQVMVEASIYNFSMARFYTKWLRDWSDAQRENGRLPTVAPNAGDWTYRQGGLTTPAWGSAYVLIPWWLYRYYGDTRVLEDHYEGMKQYVNRMDEIADEYILRTGLGDWNAPGGGVGEDANTGFTDGTWNAPAGSSPPPEGPAITSTAYFYRGAEILSKVARLLDRPEADEFERLRENIREEFNATFLVDEEDVYRTGEVDEYRQTSNVVPLAFGMVPGERVDAVVGNLVENVMEEREGHLGTGALGTKYLLQVLTEYGYPEAAYTVSTKTTYPSWGWWIEEVGATALFERWDRSLENFSRDHQYLGSIDEWFYQYVAGISEPAEPGFDHVEIAPVPAGELDWARATTETPHGEVISSWERTSTSGKSRAHPEFDLETTIPGTATGTIRIPTFGGEKVRVRESGKPIWNNGNRTRPDHPGVDLVERDGETIVVEVQSGTYQFHLEQIGAEN